VGVRKTKFKNILQLPFRDYFKKMAPARPFLFLSLPPFGRAWSFRAPYFLLTQIMIRYQHNKPIDFSPPWVKIKKVIKTTYLLSWPFAHTSACLLRAYFL